jgi:hypothetical protein
VHEGVIGEARPEMPLQIIDELASSAPPQPSCILRPSSSGFRRFPRNSLPFLVPNKRILAFFPLFFAMQTGKRRKDKKAHWNKEGVALNLNAFYLSKESARILGIFFNKSHS